MTRFALISAVIAAAGCSKHPDAARPPATPQRAAAMPAAGGSGTSGSAAAPRPVTQDEIAKRFDDCWRQWERSAWDAFQGCYASDVIYDGPGNGQPALTGGAAIVGLMKSHRAAFTDEQAHAQLVVIQGRKLVAIVLLTGNHTGPMQTPAGELPATGKSFGYYLAQVLAFDDAGKVARERNYLDNATVFHQLAPDKDRSSRSAVDRLAAPPRTVLARGDAAERANLGVAGRFADAFNRHDDKALAGVLADDVVWSDLARPRDMTRNELMRHLGQLWTGFSDLRIASAESIAAGDYVATEAVFEGTNDGDLPVMHVKKTHKPIRLPFLLVQQVAGGKIKAVWLLYQSMSLAAQLGLAAPAGK